MNSKKLALALLGAGAGAALGYLGYKKLKPDVQDKLLENEIISNLIDWKDEHHLILCKTSELDKRVLPYKSSVNMRDIGGYTNNEGKQIKWHKIYRGEELNHLSKEDFEKFSKLGITHIFDLRNSSVARKYRGPIPEGAKYTNVPVMDGIKEISLKPDYPNVVDQFMRDIYVDLVKLRGNMFAEVLRTLRDEPDAVIYVHCTNGKDRTGLMIALIELLAGVTEDQVISDYTLSNLKVNKAFKVFDNELVKEIGKKSGRLLYGTIGVDPDWLRLQLRYINENFDGIDDYLLRNTELTKYDLMTIRDNILEDIPVEKPKENEEK